MTYSDFTLTSPLSSLSNTAAPLLAITIIWHPEQARIGEQYVGGASGDVLELNRYAPLFMHPGCEALGLGHGGISRQPVCLARGADDSVVLTPPASSMVVELNGHVVKDPVQLTAAHIGAGQILTLGRAVILCIHWMHQLPKRNAVPGLIGVGSAAIAVREQIRMVAPTGLPVLLLGETGTGKEIAARAIHALSDLAQAPLVTVNMAAMNDTLAAVELFGVADGAYPGVLSGHEGLFAQADAATLFLDEIGNAPVGVQPMLLRVLEGGEYRPVGAVQDRHSSARLIAATDQDLDAAAFNQALLRRLEGFVIEMAPLRTRREDIGVLIVHLLQGQGAAVDLPVALVAELAAYDWPGNVRQLSHALKRAALMLRGDSVPTFEQVVHVVRPHAEQAPVVAPAGSTVAGRRKPSALLAREVLGAMNTYEWNIQAAAQSLGISRPSLYKLLDEHPDIRRAEIIAEEEIALAMEQCAGDVERCAAQLKTPAEALRRRWRLLRPG